MQFRLYVFAVCLGGAGILSAQSQSSTTSSSDQKAKEGTFVRRISAGATLSVLGLTQIKNDSNTTSAQLNSANLLTTDLATKGMSSRIGYGLTVQFAITDHIALAVGGYLRRLGYDLSTTLTTDTISFVNGTASTTETVTSTSESTRARWLDVPIMLRYYFKDRHTPGSRFFVEGGGAWRDVRSIGSSISSTDSSGTLTCCVSNTVQPTHRNSRGFLGGAGAQFIDPFGIRVVPEVRYTRWVSPIFDTVTTHTQRNQVEFDLTLSF